jgi:hypothetical protein
MEDGTHPLHPDNKEAGYKETGDDGARTSQDRTQFLASLFAVTLAQVLPFPRSIERRFPDRPRCRRMLVFMAKIMRG